MGNEQSTLAIIRSNVSTVLPPYKGKEGLYLDEKDRDQFIGMFRILPTLPYRTFLKHYSCLRKDAYEDHIY